MPTTPETGDHDRLLEHGSGFQGDLERGLDERKERRLPRVDRFLARGVELDDIVGPGHEPVLVRMECEHQPPHLDIRFGALDPTDAAVAVGERVGEGAGEGADGLVERGQRVDLAAVGEHLGARADARPERFDEDLAVCRASQGGIDDFDAPGPHERHCSRPLGITGLIGDRNDESYRAPGSRP